MAESDEYDRSIPVRVIYIVICTIMIIFAILLIIVYSKDKYLFVNTNTVDMLKLYNSYFNIFFCSVIVLNNLIRLIPDALTVDTVKGEDDNLTADFLCYCQAFMVNLLDKLILSLMTIYSINNYLSVFKSEFYKNHLKMNYIILIFIGFSLSLTLSIIYLKDGISAKDVLCYIHTRTPLKKITDNIYTSILFLFNAFCLIRLIINLASLKKKYQENGNVKLLQKSSHFLLRFILDLGITIIAFVYIFLLINKIFPKGSHKDLAYISICLIVELFFTVNQYLYRSFVRMITCNKYYKDEPKQLISPDIENDSENDDNNNYE